MWVIQLFQGLLTPVIAGIAVYIAWQQWQANLLVNHLGVVRSKSGGHARRQSPELIA